jgi:4-diphosphocytidyl-2-C-methyl-D-erythritol kinase
MILYPHAKINLGLRVLTKRPDGFHSIETTFFPVAWTDLLEIIPAAAFHFQSSGLPIPGKGQENICVKAWKLLETEHDIPPVSIHLHKRIPMGAGLGGGSADGAFTLLALNEIFELTLTMQQLASYAASLGSDCPFFLQNVSCIGTGRGEILQPVTIGLEGKFLVIVAPGIHVSTAEAYSMVRPQMRSASLREVLALPLADWKKNLFNDFEAPVVARYPAIGAIVEKMYASGALYASMTGSGAAVFGIFEHPVDELFPENKTTVILKI